MKTNTAHFLINYFIIIPLNSLTYQEILFKISFLKSAINTTEMQIDLKSH